MFSCLRYQFEERNPFGGGGVWFAAGYNSDGVCVLREAGSTRTSEQAEQEVGGGRVPTARRQDQQ